MEYFYMFSEGSYSDYAVGGLYKSDVELSKEDFKNYRKEMIQALLEKAGLSSENQHEVEDTFSDWALKEYIYKALHGESPPSPYSYEIRSKDIGPVRIERMKKEYLEWCEKKHEFFRTTELVFSTVDYLVGKGILTPVEYEEIHEIDG